MTLYETISTRRQVRKFNMIPIQRQKLQSILNCVSEADQLSGQHTEFELVSADEVNGAVAPHYLLSYCIPAIEAYANVGYVLQKADLYIQSIGLGSGWFMNAKPKTDKGNFCIALAVGNTDMPIRKNPDEFKRMAASDISKHDNSITQAVRLAPSSLNSQPWKLSFQKGKVIVHDAGRGMKRIILKNKLNKIDVGIAARHAVIALEQEGKKIISATPITTGKDFYIEISYS